MIEPRRTLHEERVWMYGFDPFEPDGGGVPISEPDWLEDGRLELPELPDPDPGYEDGDEPDEWEWDPECEAEGLPHNEWGRWTKLNFLGE